MWASARWWVPAGRSSYSLVNVSTARMTIRAFSTSIPPSARAARVAWNVSSSLVARCRSAWRAAGPVFVSCANQAGVEVAPLSAPTWSRSAWASIRSSSSSSRARSRRIATSAWRCSSGLIDHRGASVSRSRAPESESRNRTTGCAGGGGPAGGGGGAIVKLMTPR